MQIKSLCKSLIKSQIYFRYWQRLFIFSTWVSNSAEYYILLFLFIIISFLINTELWNWVFNKTYLWYLEGRRLVYLFLSHFLFPFLKANTMLVNFRTETSHLHRRIQEPVKHQKWSFLREKLTTENRYLFLLEGVTYFGIITYWLLPIF